MYVHWVVARELLAKQFTIALPPVHLTVSAGPAATPLAIARRFGLDVVGVVESNSAPPVEFGKIRLPEFDVLPIAELFAKLDERRAFDAAAATVARCLMGGLRLPNPQAVGQLAEYATLAHGDEPWSYLPLYPLAILTGQQWTPPASLSAGYTMMLSKNPLAGVGECERPEIMFESNHPDHDIEIALGAEDLAFALAYAELLKQPDGPFDPALATSARLGPYTVGERRYALGAGRAWARLASCASERPRRARDCRCCSALPYPLREKLKQSPVRRTGSASYDRPARRAWRASSRSSRGRSSTMGHAHSLHDQPRGISSGLQGLHRRLVQRVQQRPRRSAAVA